MSSSTFMHHGQLPQHTTYMAQFNLIVTSMHGTAIATPDTLTIASTQSCARTQVMFKEPAVFCSIYHS